MKALNVIETRTFGMHPMRITENLLGFCIKNNFDNRKNDRASLTFGRYRFQYRPEY